MPRRAQTLLLSLSLFFLVLGAKWATFDRFGSPMPDWDQWDAEAVNLYIPWFEHDHFVQKLFQPHNEHRVVLTKLQNLALVLLNGQWDSRLEATTNAVLHSALAVLCWGLACGWVARRWHAALFILTFALFGLPLAWQNILGGFHSQQYWLLGTSVAAIVTLPFVPAFRPAWWLGAAGAILALGSMGSGFLAAFVVLLLVGWRSWTRQLSLRTAWPTLVVCAAVTALGALTRVEVYYHQQLKAKSAHDFVFSILRSLEWPLRDHDWAGIILWLPWLIVAVFVLSRGRDRALAETQTSTTPSAAANHPSARATVVTSASEAPNARRRDVDTYARLAPDTTAPVIRPTLTGAPVFSAQVIVALGGWVLIQIVATAYARGAGADYPASRYMDTLAFGALANGIALAWCLTFVPRRVALQWPLAVLSIAWMTGLGLGLRDVLERNLRNELPDAKKYYIAAEAHMRRYLATNDPKALAYPDIPYPSAEGIVERLAHPSLRALMPLPIRPPLPLPPALDRAALLTTGEAPASASTVLPGPNSNAASGANSSAPSRTNANAASLANSSAPAGVSAPSAAATGVAARSTRAIASSSFLENDARAADPERAPRRGLSPATAALDASVSWGSFAPDATATAAWRSEPLKPGAFRWLKFETAGDLGRPEAAVHLTLRDARSDAVLAVIKPTKVAGDTWRAAYVRTPSVPFVVAAEDASTAHWLAFSPPIEMGGGSYLAWQATKQGRLIFWCALAVTVATALLSSFSRRRQNG